MQNPGQSAPSRPSRISTIGSAASPIQGLDCDPLAEPKSSATLSQERVLTLLKQATSEAHKSIEAVPRLAALQSSDLDLQQYAETLQRYYAHFAAYEPGIFVWLERCLPTPVLQKRRRTDLIARDLASLGQAITPILREVPPGSVAEATGWLYVHEGASLGGRVILRSLRENLGAACHGATAFLEGHGKDTASVWRESRAIIGSLIRDKRELAEAIAGANAAFSALARRMR